MFSIFWSAALNFSNEVKFQTWMKGWIIVKLYFTRIHKWSWINLKQCPLIPTSESRNRTHSSMDCHYEKISRFLMPGSVELVRFQNSRQWNKEPSQARQELPRDERLQEYSVKKERKIKITRSYRVKLQISINRQIMITSGNNKTVVNEKKKR